MKYLIMLGFLTLSSGLFSAQDSENEWSATDKAVAMAVSKTAEVMEQTVTEAISVLKSSKDFVMQEAPKVVKEYLSWKFNKSAMWILIGLGIILLGQVQGRAWWKDAYDEKKYDSHDREGLAFLAFAFKWPITMAGIILSVTNVYNIIYILSAPRIFLIENIIELIKRGNL